VQSNQIAEQEKILVTTASKLFTVLGFSAALRITNGYEMFIVYVRVIDSWWDVLTLPLATSFSQLLNVFGFSSDSWVKFVMKTIWLCKHHLFSCTAFSATEVCVHQLLHFTTVGEFGPDCSKWLL